MLITFHTHPSNGLENHECIRARRDRRDSAQHANQPNTHPSPDRKYPSLNVETAFEAQKISAWKAIAKDGDRLVGYKLGNIAKVMQDAFGVDSPDYGFLLNSLFRYEGTKIPLKDFIKPHIELEPALVLKGP